MTDDYKEYKEFMARVCTAAHKETDDLAKQLDVTKDQAIGLYVITMLDKLTATISSNTGVSDTSTSNSDSASGKQAKES